jgi:chemotaxis protein MotA
MDKSTIVGIFFALGGIVAGLIMEGGKIAQILQPTAALIVFGGTLGAVLVQFPLPTVLEAFKKLGHVFLDRRENPAALVQELVKYAQRARISGIVSLDSDVQRISDPFLRKTLMLAVDGTEPRELRKIMEPELDNHADRAEKIAQVFESAGGFAPTIGIIGAVLGLIQVMEHLGNIDEVGRGIAVAFVATIYGVASANLLFLPCSGKLKIKSRAEQMQREMTLDGVISILEGMNPRMLEAKLLGYLLEQGEEQTPRRAGVSENPVLSGRRA